MFDYLPPQVFADILSKLPVKTLLRLRCVSKSWRSLISSPNFISTHLNQSSSNNTHLLLRYFPMSSKKERYSLRLDTRDDEAFDELVELKCPFKTRSGNFFRVVGTCNGLICLSDDNFGYTYTIIIWNPAIRKCVTLPMPRVCFEAYGPYMFALGFGVDPVTNDYKVVRVSYLQGDENEGYVVPPEVEVYALSTGSWKTVSAVNAPYNMVEYFWSSAFVNGAVHWVVYNRNESGAYCNRILVFDMGSEVFSEIELPQQLVHEYPLDLSVAACGDTIAVFRYDGRSRGQFCERCAVWVMQQYGMVGSWSEKFVSYLEGGISMVLGFRKNGELLLEKCIGKLVSYHHGNNEIKNLGIHGGKDTFYVDVFAESLVLLDGKNGVQGEQLKSCNEADSEEEPVLSELVEVLEGYELLKHWTANLKFAEYFLSY